MGQNGPTDETLNLENCVLAIADPNDAEQAATALRGKGFELVELTREEDVERLQPKREGLLGALSKAAAALGDELRIMDAIDRALSEGQQVLIIPVEEEQAVTVSDLLKESGAKSIWDFRGWTFAKTGSEDHASATEGDRS